MANSADFSNRVGRIRLSTSIKKVSFYKIMYLNNFLPIAESGPCDILLTHAKHTKLASPKRRTCGNIVIDIASVEQESALLPELDMDEILAWSVLDMVFVGMVMFPSI